MEADHVWLRPAGRFRQALRPLTGADLTSLMQGHYGLTAVESMFALGIQVPRLYARACEGLQVVSFGQELLLRYYDQWPGYAPWAHLHPRDAFDLVYGPLLRQFGVGQPRQAAERELMARFIVAMGRSVSTDRRWFQAPRHVMGSRKGSPELMIFLKHLVRHEDEAQKVFDSLTRAVWRARGGDLDVLVPLPDPGNPPEPRRTGPKKKVMDGAAPRAAALRVDLIAAVAQVRNPKAPELIVAVKPSDEKRRRAAASKSAAA